MPILSHCQAQKSNTKQLEISVISGGVVEEISFPQDSRPDRRLHASEISFSALGRTILPPHHSLLSMSIFGHFKR